MDVFGIAGTLGLVLGVILVAGGLYARRGRRFRHRQGAEVLACSVAVLGAFMLLVGAFATIGA